VNARSHVGQTKLCDKFQGRNNTDAARDIQNPARRAKTPPEYPMDCHIAQRIFDECHRGLVSRQAYAPKKTAQYQGKVHAFGYPLSLAKLY